MQIAAIYNGDNGDGVVEFSVSALHVAGRNVLVPKGDWDRIYNISEGASGRFYNVTEGASGVQTPVFPNKQPKLLRPAGRFYDINDGRVFNATTQIRLQPF